MTNPEQLTFFSYFKPIALICKAMGVFPMQNIYSSSDPKQLKVKLFSFAQLYSLCIFVGNIYMIFYFCGFMFTQETSLHLCFVVYITLARTLLSFIFSGSYAKNLPTLIRLLDSFDRKKNALFCNEKSGCNTFKCYLLWTVLPIFIGAVCLALVCWENANIIFKILPPDVGVTNVQVAACFFGVLSIWQIIPLLLYMYFAVKVISNFQSINNSMTKKGFDCLYEENIKYSEDMFSYLEYFRHMHGMLTKTVDEIGRYFGSFMAVDQLCIIIMIIANICAIMQFAKDIDLLVLTCLNIVIVAAAVGVSHHVKDSGLKVLEFLQAILFSKTDQRSQAEVQTFMLQVLSRPPKVSAAGFFTIDKRQIPSILSSIATYLVVSLQFISSNIAPTKNGTSAS